MKISMAVLCLVCGCMNIDRHYTGRMFPYGGTCAICTEMSEAFRVRPELHDGSELEALLSHDLAVVLLPAMLVDLPFEVVADTVTLPYDMFAK